MRPLPAIGYVSEGLDTARQQVEADNKNRGYRPILEVIVGIMLNRLTCSNAAIEV